MRQTFIEKFGKTYTYPYGTSFNRPPKGLAGDSHDQAENIAEDHCERVLLGKRTMRPFHLECPKTQKRVCYCAKEPQTKESLNTVQSMAYDMHLYYQGYQADFQQKMLRKLQMEQERLMKVEQKRYADTFDKFIDSLDANEVQEQLASLQENPNLLLNAQECSYCKTTIFDAQIAQSWKNDKGQVVSLCGKCNQSYISGLIDPTSDNKKVTRYMQNVVGTTTSAVQSSVINQASLQSKHQFNSANKTEVTKTDNAISKTKKAERVQESSAEIIADEDNCKICRKEWHGKFVECDGCEQWHCEPCSGLSSVQMQNIETVNYVCKKCKSKIQK